MNPNLNSSSQILFDLIGNVVEGTDEGGILVLVPVEGVPDGVESSQARRIRDSPMNQKKSPSRSFSRLPTM